MEIAGASALRLARQSQPRVAFSLLPVCTYFSLNQNPPLLSLSLSLGFPFLFDFVGLVSVWMLGKVLGKAKEKK